MIDSLFGKHHPGICWQFRVLLLLLSGNFILSTLFPRSESLCVYLKGRLIANERLHHRFVWSLPGREVTEAITAFSLSANIKPLTVASKLGILQGRTYR